MRQFVVACSVFVMAACGGSGVAGGTGGTTGAGTGGGSSGGNCPDLSGTWTITTHCESEFINVSSEVTQTGCSFTDSAAGFTCTGTVSADGSVSQTCDAEGGVQCAGQVSGSTLTLLCSGDCVVVLEKQ